MTERKTEITVRDAGRRGGRSTKASHPPEYFTALARQGGLKTLRERGVEFYREISRKGVEARRLTSSQSEDPKVEEPAITVKEAGSLGGKKVRENYSDEHYIAIGKKVGQQLLADRGVEFFVRIGEKGGEATSAARGSEYLRGIASKGGKRTLERRGPEFFREIGKKGGSK